MVLDRRSLLRLSAAATVGATTIAALRLPVVGHVRSDERGSSEDVFREVYLGRTIVSWHPPDGPLTDDHGRPALPRVTIDGRFLPLIYLRGSTSLLMSAVNHYSVRDTVRGVSRAAVITLGGAAMPLFAPHVHAVD